jgi:hypothetical protein
MESTPMVMDGRINPEYGYITESNAYVQHNSHQIAMTFFTELEKSILMFTWKYKQP